MNNFIMMMGLPGVGKDYFVENRLKYAYPNAIIVSSDDIREEVFNDINDQTHNSEVFFPYHKFWKSLKKIGINSFKCLLEFTHEAI